MIRLLVTFRDRQLARVFAQQSGPETVIRVEILSLSFTWTVLRPADVDQVRDEASGVPP